MQRAPQRRNPRDHLGPVNALLLAIAASLRSGRSAEPRPTTTPTRTPTRTASHRRVFKSTVAMALVWVAILVSAPTALADAAGPTDYRSEILSVEPAVSSVELEIIGGDSFLRLTQLEPVVVEVSGYFAEPYLRFDADGTVVENRRSPSKWQNEDRYGTEDQLPSFVDKEAPPQWKRVALNGDFSWHDHRIHWMNTVKPPGAAPGDQILEQVIPLVIDGQAVKVTVGSWLLEGPSPFPALLGLIVGAPLAMLGLKGGRLALSTVGVLAAASALLVGTIAWRSVPRETEPEQWLWLLPAMALAAILMVMMLRNSLATTVYLDGLGVVCGVSLIAWVITRSDALLRALIPSNVPDWFDRFTIAAAAMTGLVIAARSLFGLARPARLMDQSDPFDPPALAS